MTDGSKRLVYRYTEDELDIRHQLDHETQVNQALWSNTGATIGAAYEIVNNRTRLTPYKAVRLDGTLDIFRVVSQIAIVLPTQPIEESLSRMRLLDLGNATFEDKAHFSRPSNGIFVPPEFRSINCYVKRCKGPAPRTDSTITPDNSIEADLEPPGLQCGWSGGGGAVCAVPVVDRAADDLAEEWPIREPFERSVTMRCQGQDVLTFGFRTTSWTTTQDPCATDIPTTTDMAGALHSHPFFRTPDEYVAGVGCGGDRTRPTVAQLGDLNFRNRNFGPRDDDFVLQTRRPLYMRVPQGYPVKKMFIDPDTDRIRVVDVPDSGP